VRGQSAFAKCYAALICVFNVFLKVSDLKIVPILRVEILVEIFFFLDFHSDLKS